MKLLPGQDEVEVAVSLDRDIHLVLDDGYEVQVRASKPASCTGSPGPASRGLFWWAGQGALAAG